MAALKTAVDWLTGSGLDNIVCVIFSNSLHVESTCKLLLFFLFCNNKRVPCRVYYTYKDFDFIFR